MKNLLLILVFTVFGLHVKANTDDSKIAHLYLGEVTINPVVELSGKTSKGYLQNLAIINQSEKAITMEVVSFEFYEDGKIIHEDILFAEAIFNEANNFSKYEKQGIIEDYGLASGVIQVIDGSSFSASRIVQANEVLMFSKKSFNVKGQPDKIIVKAKGYNEDMEFVNLEYVISI